MRAQEGSNLQVGGDGQGVMMRAQEGSNLQEGGARRGGAGWARDSKDQFMNSTQESLIMIEEPCKAAVLFPLHIYVLGALPTGPHLKPDLASTPLAPSISVFCSASGSFLRPAVASMNSGVEDHCRSGTTAWAHSSSGPRDWSRRPSGSEEN